VDRLHYSSIETEREQEVARAGDPFVAPGTIRPVPPDLKMPSVLCAGRV
jgi:hypothetical protein